MSSSWKIPAQASPSYEDSEPAELGHFNFRAETELTFPIFLQFFKLQSNYQLCYNNMILINFMIIHLNLLAQKVFLELNNLIELHNLVIFNTSLL